MIIILFLFLSLIFKYCPRLKPWDTDCAIMALQWLKPLAMIIILFLFLSIIFKYCPRFKPRNTYCAIMRFQRLKPLAMFIILFLFLSLIFKYCPRFQPRETDYKIFTQWLKPLAMFCKPNYDPYFLKKYKTKKCNHKGCIFIQVTNQNKPFKK